MKNLIKRLKNKKSASQTPVPRSKEEIDREVSALVTRLGLTEYEIFVKTENLKAMNHQCVVLAKEQEARKLLDLQEKTAKEEAEAKLDAESVGDTNVQS